MRIHYKIQVCIILMMRVIFSHRGLTADSFLEIFGVLSVRPVYNVVIAPLPSG